MFIALLNELTRLQFQNMYVQFEFNMKKYSCP